MPSVRRGVSRPKTLSKKQEASCVYHSSRKMSYLGCRDGPNGDRIVVSRIDPHTYTEIVIRPQEIRVEVGVRFEALPRKQLVLSRRDTSKSNSAIFVCHCG